MATRLGRYDVVRTLAKGAMTDLLLGRASGMEGFERYVAIKRLRKEHAKDPAVLEMFVNEARLAAALHHHNIVQVVDIGDATGAPFFAMEYVHGVDARALLAHLAKRNEQLPFPHVVSIIAAVAAALHHAHEQRGPDGAPLGIVHRQVTPGNILLGFDGNVKIVDFGIAKAAIKRSETGVGVLRGSAPYMAPEQCAGQRVDRRSDVFALGIVLYELATVRRLFKGGNEFLTMSAVISAEVPRPSQYRRDVPAELEVLMLKALARDPKDRYQTAGEIAEELDRVARTVGVGASTTQLAKYMQLQFGEVKEPWLAGLPDNTEPEITAVDFDGPASGLAPPPEEASKNNEIPKSISATKSSPISYARTRAKTDVTDVDEADPLAPPPLPPQKTDVAAPPPPPRNVASTKPSKNDMTAVVEPLSVLAARAQTVQPRKATSLLVWVGAGSVVVAGIIATIALWPSDELGPTKAAPTTMEMTARDYEAVHANADAAVAERVAVETPDAAIAIAVAEPVEPEITIDEPPVVDPPKPVMRPATKPVKRAKPAAKRPATKRVLAKKPAATPPQTKWNPDGLFPGK